MSRPYGTTIFCDDIRDEVSGKKTYVGVYFNELVISGILPVVLPTFGLAITYLEPLSDPVLPVNIKVFVPGPSDEGELAAEVELPIDRFDAIEKVQQDPSAHYRAHIMHFKISPFMIAHEGYVKVRAYIGDEEIRLGSLKVRIANDAEKETLGLN